MCRSCLARVRILNTCSHHNDVMPRRELFRPISTHVGSSRIPYLAVYLHNMLLRVHRAWRSTLVARPLERRKLLGSATWSIYEPAQSSEHCASTRAYHYGGFYHHKSTTWEWCWLHISCILRLFARVACLFVVWTIVPAEDIYLRIHSSETQYCRNHNREALENILAPPWFGSANHCLWYISGAFTRGYRAHGFHISHRNCPTLREHNICFPWRLSLGVGPGLTILLPFIEYM